MTKIRLHLVVLFLVIGFISLIFFYFKFSENIVLPNNFFILIGCFFSRIIIFFDDNKPIHPIIKLLIQLLICYLCLTSLKLFEFPLPLKVTMLFSVLVWVYIINISNFVDGSDGFVNNFFAIFFFSIIIFYHYYDLVFNLSYLAVVTLASSILGFLFFNKPKAKLFMGDVGSISIGFVIGYTFLELFLKGYYAIVLSAFSYPITDCTITILKKLRMDICLGQDFLIIF